MIAEAFAMFHERTAAPAGATIAGEAVKEEIVELGTIASVVAVAGRDGLLSAPVLSYATML